MSKSVQDILSFIKENDIKHKKVGKKYFISKKSLEKFMKME